MTIPLYQSFLRRFLPSLKLPNNDSGLLISYPKSGRTWLRLLLQGLSCNVKATHAGSNISQGLHFDSISLIDLTVANRVLFLFRNPLDVVVSSWFQHSYRINREPQIDFKDFIRNPSYGIEKIVNFNLMYLEFAHSCPDNFACINYEVLLSHTSLSLEQILY